jgi:hypothetical protein
LRYHNSAFEEGAGVLFQHPPRVIRKRKIIGEQTNRVVKA